MDFTITVNRERLCVQSRTPCGEQMRKGNYSSAGERVMYGGHGCLLLPAITADQLVVPGADGDGASLDFADQYSTLLRARAMRLAGHDYDALGSLISLRATVMVTCDPKSNTLLLDIDREIAAAFSVCKAQLSAEAG